MQELTEVQEVKKAEEAVDASPKRLLKLISDYRTEVDHPRLFIRKYGSIFR